VYLLRNGSDITFNTTTTTTNDTEVSLSLVPVSLSSETVRVTHAGFSDHKLFPSPGGNKTIGSVVVATSIINGSLSSNVTISYNSLEIENISTLNCSFLDFTLNAGRGNWSTEGCKLVINSINKTVCSCDHLTHFALIAEPSRMEEEPQYLLVMEALSVVAVSFSAVFLIISLVLYLGTWKMRVELHNHLIVNFFISLLCFSVIYVGVVYAKSNDIACIIFSTFFHYTFLVALLSMLVQFIYTMLQGICTGLRFYSLITIICTWSKKPSIIMYRHVISPYSCTNSSSDSYCGTCL
jgi:G protein-coupled receptor 64